MGFEVTFKYHEKAEKGYDTDKVKELKRQVGEPFEEVSLEKLAASIMMQMARRDIWVVDCDIVELKRNPIAFRETSGGVVIKGKKFTLDTMASEIKSSDVAPQAFNVPSNNNAASAGAPIPSNSPSPIAQAQKGIAQTVGELGAPNRMEIYDPDPQLASLGYVKGFTPGKKYPIFKEMRDPREESAGRALPMLYTTVDDSGKRQNVPQDYFRPITVGLGPIFDNPNPRPAVHGDGLVWDGVVSEGAAVSVGAGADGMPSLRRGGAKPSMSGVGAQNMLSQQRQLLSMPNLRDSK